MNSSEKWSKHFRNGKKTLGCYWWSLGKGLCILGDIDLEKSIVGDDFNGAKKGSFCKLPQCLRASISLPFKSYPCSWAASGLIPKITSAATLTLFFSRFLQIIVCLVRGYLMGFLGWLGSCFGTLQILYPFLFVQKLQKYWHNNTLRFQDQQNRQWQKLKK